MWDWILKWHARAQTQPMLRTLRLHADFNFPLADPWSKIYGKGHVYVVVLAKMKVQWSYGVSNKTFKDKKYLKSEQDVNR